MCTHRIEPGSCLLYQGLSSCVASSIHRSQDTPSLCEQFAIADSCTAQVKLLCPVSGKYQVGMGVNQPGRDNGSPGINDRDAIARSSCGVLEHRFCIVIGADPDDQAAMHCQCRVWYNLEWAMCPR